MFEKDTEGEYNSQLLYLNKVKVLAVLVLFACNPMPSRIRRAIYTERRGRVVNTPASYWGGHEFKYRPEDQLSWQVFRGFPQALQINAGIVPLN
jgi:hypothetical protein